MADPIKPLQNPIASDAADDLYVFGAAGLQKLYAAICRAYVLPTQDDIEAHPPSADGVTAASAAGRG